MATAITVGTVSVVPCDVLNVLIGYQQAILSQITNKFGALQRLARLLEEAGDLADIISPILQLPNTFIPLSLIAEGATIYNHLRDNCPMLNLPEASLDNIYDFQYRVALSYADLMKKLDLHQYNRMDQLQARLDEAIGEALDAMGRDWVQCAQSICDLAVSDDFLQLRDQFLTRVSTAVTGQSAYEVLNEAQREKVTRLNNARDFLGGLADTSREDVQSLFTRWN